MGLPRIRDLDGETMRAWYSGYRTPVCWKLLFLVRVIRSFSRLLSGRGVGNHSLWSLLSSKASSPTSCCPRRKVVRSHNSTNARLPVLCCNACSNSFFKFASVRILHRRTDQLCGACLVEASKLTNDSIARSWRSNLPTFWLPLLLNVRHQV